MENVQTQPNYPKGLTFEDVWAALQETDRMMKESTQEFARRQEETERQMKESAQEYARRQEEKERQMQEDNRKLKESQEETARQMQEDTRKLKESQKETDRQMQEYAQKDELRKNEMERYLKRLGKQLGYFKNSFGNVVQHMIAPNLLAKFQEMGFDFEEASNKVKVRNKKLDLNFEVDVFLQNGDIAMLIEIKSALSISDINKHVIRLEKMRKHADSRGDKRRFLGAVAGIVVEDAEREYALDQGFFLIEPSGKNFNITPPHDKPKEW